MKNKTKIHSKNMANFETFGQIILSSINLSFLRSVLYFQKTFEVNNRAITFTHIFIALYFYFYDTVLSSSSTYLYGLAFPYTFLHAVQCGLYWGLPVIRIRMHYLFEFYQDYCPLNIYMWKFMKRVTLALYYYFTNHLVNTQQDKIQGKVQFGEAALFTLKGSFQSKHPQR